MPNLINLHPFTFSTQSFWVFELRSISRLLDRPELPCHTVFNWQILWGRLAQNWAVDKNPWQLSFPVGFLLRSICFFFATCRRLKFKIQCSILNYCCWAFVCTNTWLGWSELAHFGDPFTAYSIPSNPVGQKFTTSLCTCHFWNFRDWNRWLIQKIAHFVMDSITTVRMDWKTGLNHSECCDLIRLRSRGIHHSLTDVDCFLIRFFRFLTVDFHPHSTTMTFYFELSLFIKIQNLW